MAIHQLIIELRDGDENEKVNDTVTSAKPDTTHKHSMDYPNPLSILLIALILLFFLYSYGADYVKRVLLWIMKFFGFPIPSTLIINSSVKKKLDGHYEYTCTQTKPAFGKKHGGKMSIKVDSDKGDLIAWHLIGSRTWAQTGNGSNLNLEIPIEWNSTAGVIHNSRDFIYHFVINGEKKETGFATGKINFSKSQNEINEFTGDYWMFDDVSYKYCTGKIKIVRQE